MEHIIGHFKYAQRVIYNATELLAPLLKMIEKA